MLSITSAVEGGGRTGFSLDCHYHSPHQWRKGIHEGMAFLEVSRSMDISAAVEEASSEDLSKKIRKPYTITKSRESWTEQEHDKFLEALQLFDRDWKKIEAFIGSKTVIQIRSHAQKYFLKVQKNGTREHVPPPRPKRKAAHPYPQKAFKNGHQVPQFIPSFQTYSCDVLKSDESSVIRNSTNATVQKIDVLHTTTEEVEPSKNLIRSKSCGNNTENPTSSWPNCKKTDQNHHSASIHAMPDFAHVYRFIGSIFDPSKRDHLKKLMEMDPIDVETVLLLMRNLSINLRNPHFEDHRKLLYVHEVCGEEEKSSDANGIVDISETMNALFMVKAEH